MYLYMMRTGFTTMFPNLNQLYQLILSLPATSVSSGRSFSALQFVKNKSRSTMIKEGLTDLMVIAVEGQRAKAINVDAVVENFWRNCIVIPPTKIPASDWLKSGLHNPTFTSICL